MLPTHANAADLAQWANRLWVENKRTSGMWRDIRVLDADDLETWLELAPAVHAWISRLLGKDPGDTQALDTFWMDWQEATEPPLRQNSSTTLRSVWRRPSKPFFRPFSSPSCIIS